MTQFKVKEARVRDLEFGPGIHRDTDFKGLLCIYHKTTKTFAVLGEVTVERTGIWTAC